MPGHSEGRELFFEAKIRHVHTMCNSGSADEADIKHKEVLVRDISALVESVKPTLHIN